VESLQRATSDELGFKLTQSSPSLSTLQSIFTLL
jgi:hypothetical protein